MNQLQILFIKLFIIAIGFTVWLAPAIYWNELPLLIFTWIPALIITSYLEPKNENNF